jgi:hypothetical protein
MPKTVIDYTKSCVYRLIYNDITYYVGSTTNMRQRKTAHKNNSINENGDKYDMKLYKFIRDNEGFENWNMVMIQAYPECKTGNELRMYERQHYEFYKPSLNSQLPYVTEEEIINRNKQNSILFREINKEQIVIDKAEYYVENRERILEKLKNEYAENSNRHKNYYIDNKEEINKKSMERCMCECGVTYSRRHKSTHQATKKHINKMELINEEK